MSRMSNTRVFLLAGLMVAVGLALFASPFASGSPDGLEKVAQDKGFSETAADHGLSDSPVAGLCLALGATLIGTHRGT